MVAGGGSPVLLIPLVGGFYGPEAVAPVVTLGMLLGNGQRSLVLREAIDWPVTGWYLPGSLVGALLGAYGVSRIQLDALQSVVAIALVWIAWDQWKTSAASFSAPFNAPFSDDLTRELTLPHPIPPDTAPPKLPAWSFLPLAFGNGLASAMIGSTGPILNPAYLRYGLVKERMLATKALHNVCLHLIKILAYLYFGAFQPEYWLYGAVIGIAAWPGNWLGQKVLERMSPEQFQRSVLTLVAFSGLIMLAQQLSNWLSPSL